LKLRSVVLSPEARADLTALYDWVAEGSAPHVAMNYLERVESWLRSFDVASDRGTLRADIRPGLRIAGFERRLTVAFTVEEARVVILRVFRAGRHWEADFNPE
jgi:toxin ParE1/3/4